MQRAGAGVAAGVGGGGIGLAGSAGSSSNGASIGRRRGAVKRKKYSDPTVRLVLGVGVLVLVATVALLGLLLRMSTSGGGSGRTSSRNQPPLAVPLPGVPNLLRGKVDAVAVANAALLAAAKQKARALFRDPAALAAAADAPDAAAPQGQKDEYPYPLDLVAETYDIAARFVVLGGNRYAEYTAGASPYAVSAAVRSRSDAVARTRRYHVKRAMRYAWGGYVKHAFGMDELSPQTGRGANGWGGQGITLVDALDTLWLMNMTAEFYQARDWVRDHLDHSTVGAVSVFETTIRDLGGLLAAYDWSGDAAFLTKAADLGERLLHCFDNSVTGIPFGQVSLSDGRASNIGWTGGNAIVAEFGTLQLEFRYLAKATGRPEFATKTDRVFAIMNEIAPPNGLYPYYYSNTPPTGTLPTPANDKLTFGAMADSFYEYMLKIWIQGGRTEPMYRAMYDKAMEGMHHELLQTSTPSGLTYIADKNNGVLDPKMDHLVCFMGGLLALGAYTDPLGVDSPRAIRDLTTARALTYTCYQMYARMNTGISPEFVQFAPGEDFQVGRGAPHYLLRPEAVESMFILHQMTGDPVYREWGWEVFQAIEKYCKTPFAYGALSNVQDTTGKPRDKMESFFLAETLKYLYLLQDPDTEVDVLRKHVFNTEAHPMRIFTQLPVETQ